MRSTAVRVAAAAIFLVLAPWAALVLWGGCASTPTIQRYEPIVRQATFTGVKAEVLTCVQVQIMALGYTIDDGSAEIGFLRASKVERASSKAPLPGADVIEGRWTETLSVSVAVIGEMAAMQVVGTTWSSPQLGNPVLISPSQQAKESVDRVLSACGKPGGEPGALPAANTAADEKDSGLPAKTAVDEDDGDGDEDEGDEDEDEDRP